MPARDREPLWAKVTVKVAPEAVAGVADVMLSVSHGVEEQPRGAEVGLVAYVSSAHTAKALERIRERLAALRAAGLEVGSAAVAVRRVRSRKWEDAWKAGLDVVRVPPRIVIKPTWKDYAAQSGEEAVVELDPGMAFGTGDHATTRGCLAALGRCIRGGELVFDIGAGSGVLSIAAAKLGARRVVGVEIDESAARVAAENIGLNRVAHIVAVACGDGLRCLRSGADVIVANLTSHQVAALAPQVRCHLAPGGVFIASGISTAHERAVRVAGEAEGFSVRDRRREGEWLTMVWELGTDAPASG